MSETTPLTAANAARAMTLLVMASRVDPNLRSAVADVESYIAELQREIEGYRQAMELELCPAHRVSETLSVERALNLLRLSARVDPLLRQAVADVDATIEALQAEVTTLRTALEEAAGLFNEMHLPLQGHRASQCTLRTDFCVTAEHVQAALAECLADALEAEKSPD